MLPAALHPAVEGTPVGEVEVRQPRLPLGAKKGGGDRVGLAVVLGHGSGPLGAVLDLEARLVSRREVAVVHEVIAWPGRGGAGRGGRGSRRAATDRHHKGPSLRNPPYQTL